ncbi:MAG: MmcQ/YjbR family DNA-binding protein [Planctomycetota bacterium]
MAARRSKPSAGDRLVRHLREHGLARFPGAHLKSPWPGHLDLAVKDKTFAYLNLEGDPFHISVKLPQSNGIALSMPGVVPAAYGLGKSGWVTLSVEHGEALPPVELMELWLDESYRAQAPKTLLRQLDAASGGGGAPQEKAAAKAPARRRRPGNSR